MGHTSSLPIKRFIQLFKTFLSFLLVAKFLKGPFCDLLDSRDCHLERRKFVNFFMLPLRWDLIPLQIHLGPGGLPCQTPKATLESSLQLRWKFDQKFCSCCVS